MAKDEKSRGWQPPEPEDKRAVMAWVSDVVSQGEQYNSSLLSNKDIGQAVDLISGRAGKKINQSRSSLTSNRGKRALREVIANIADVRAVSRILLRQ